MEERKAKTRKKKERNKKPNYMEMKMNWAPTKARCGATATLHLFAVAMCVAAAHTSLPYPQPCLPHVRCTFRCILKKFEFPQKQK